MSDSNAPQSPSLSYVKAKNRKDAVRKMIRTDPLLSALYVEGEKGDGKAGWVNAIRDQQTGDAYRLLFYIDKLMMAPEFKDFETYEVLYGAITEGSALNFPRALFTTTGAINLMRDGIPSKRFVDAVKRGIIQIVPYELGRDMETQWLRKSGYAYVCVYDRDGQGIRVLDLLEYGMIYDNRKTDEIQVHKEHELVVGDTQFVRPFLLKYAVGSQQPAGGTRSEADEALRRMM